MDHTGIAVIESNWWRKSNVSVRGLYALVADIASSNPNAFHYEMANSEAALKEAIPRIASYRECRYLSIAMHGDENGLSLLNGERLSRTELRNILCRIKITNRSNLRGLYLGSCLFATNRLADHLFSADIGVHWIAGFTTAVDWILSSALDLLFFNELLDSAEETEIQRIERVATRLRQIAPGLIKELGFGIYTRKRAVGGAKNLLSLVDIEL